MSWQNGALFIGLLVVCSLSPLATADEATDPERAGPRFRIQGEYVGTIELDGEPTKVGAQVVAWTKGEYLVRGYLGGLPGAGWNRSEIWKGSGTTADGVTRITGEDGYRLAIKDGRMAVTSPEGTDVGELKRIIRKSKTLGKKPPPGAVVLFDGTTAENFTPQPRRRKREEESLMTGDGLLRSGVISKRLFQSCTLHLEFRTPFYPERTGQARGNSGCYLQGRYEVQILDSFGLEGEHNECGGIYSVAPPALNMCYPPLSWQTYDIEYTAPRYDDKGNKVAGARMTVYHNGVLVHRDRVIDKKNTTAAIREASPSPDPLYLQAHGSPVHYRNIWLVEK